MPLLGLLLVFTAPASTPSPVAGALNEYYARLTESKPFHIRSGAAFTRHQRELREKLLRAIGLKPLPERIPLALRESEPLEHPWCTVRRVYYRLWPRVYVSGLLYLPRRLSEKPAAAVLCPHGHWKQGNAHPVVQTRCLVLARKGYITFSPAQNHYEDLNLGISNQTIGVWNTMRALDVLESRPDVDRTRIGVCGCSGGGLQTQMLVALDDRVACAVIAGYTCESREIMFSTSRTHCGCNHFPQYMRYTDHPEISALALPTPLSYLTMNDWTHTFRERNLPTIRELYRRNGLSDHVDATYEPTEHNYDRSKRERTYWWLDRWLRGVTAEKPAPEPQEVTTFPPKKLFALTAPVPDNAGFRGISHEWRSTRRWKRVDLPDRRAWERYRTHMRNELRHLLGEDAVLPRPPAAFVTVSRTVEKDLVFQRGEFPSEGPIRVPAIMLRSAVGVGKRPVTIFCSGAGKEKMLASRGPREVARTGALVVLPDVRFVGVYSPTELARHKIGPWARNAIVWGRPLVGMGSTDLRAVLDGILDDVEMRKDADLRSVRLVIRDAGALACAALFAAALDARFTTIDVDLQEASFENGKLPSVPFVLQHGDVLQWAALLADRTLIVRNPPRDAEGLTWLAEAFRVAGNTGGLTIKRTK